MSQKQKRTIAVLASGEGSNFESIARASASGELGFKVRALIVSRENIGALKRAETLGIPSHVVRPKDFSDEATWDLHLCGVLRDLNVDWVVLAGFLKKIGPAVLGEFSGRIINSHPSLLPKYGGPGMYGLRVHQAVIAAGEKTTGITIHRVTDNYDEGPILAQKELEVLSSDTPESLQDRVKAVENSFIVEALAKLESD